MPKPASVSWKEGAVNKEALRGVGMNKLGKLKKAYPDIDWQAQATGTEGETLYAGQLNGWFIRWSMPDNLAIKGGVKSYINSSVENLRKKASE